MGIEQAADKVYNVVMGMISGFAPIVIEIILLVAFFNFIRLLKKMISGIEQNVFLIVQQNARIEQKLNKILENQEKENK